MLVEICNFSKYVTCVSWYGYINVFIKNKLSLHTFV